MNVASILERIELDRPVDVCNLELLNEICISLVAHIPFETLDLFGGPRRIFSMEAIYEKLVVEKRGGVCYELNLLLHWLLSEIGYKVILLGGYGYKSENGFTEIPDHLILLVEVAERKWITDVGWGGSSFVFPLEFIKDVTQSQPNGVYKIKFVSSEGIYIVEKRKQNQIRLGEDKVQESKQCKICNIYQTDADWDVIYGFKSEPREMDYFKEGFDYAQNDHPFTTTNTIAVLQDRYGRRFLIGKVMVEKQYIDPMTIKVKSIEKCDEKELVEILKEKFGIVLDFELKPKSELYWNII